MKKTAFVAVDVKIPDCSVVASEKRGQRGQMGNRAAVCDHTAILSCVAVSLTPTETTTQKIYLVVGDKSGRRSQLNCYAVVKVPT